MRATQDRNTNTTSKNTQLTNIYDYSFKLAAIKLVTPTKEHLEKHYADLSDKPFFKGLVTCACNFSYLSSG